ncbi:hypothetical protein ABPG75_004402 [Micractinium tetrahymenae]
MLGAAPAIELVDAVVGPEWAAALAGASSTGHLQAPLARPDLWLEAQLLEKLLYKNANQHRGAQHFQRLQEVRRLLSLLRSQQLDRRVGALHEALAAAQQRGSLPRGSVLMAYGGDQRRVPSHQAASGVLRILGTACQLIEQLAPAVQRASLQLLAQLAHSFFMPLCLTALAALARIQVLAGQLLLDVVRAYNALAEVAALLPPIPSSSSSSASAAAAAATAEAAAVMGWEAGAAGEVPLPQLLRAQWRRGLPRLERVPCPPGESLAEQAATACTRYGLHIVEVDLGAAPASAVVLEEQPATAGPAVGPQQRRGKPRGKQAAGPLALGAAPVLAVMEDRGVPISREAFASAAGKAASAAPAAVAAAPPETPPAAAAPELPLFGVVEDSAPEEDAAGNVASLMEGEARGHLYRRAALGLGPLARQPGKAAAKRPRSAAALGQAPAVPPAMPGQAAGLVACLCLLLAWAPAASANGVGSGGTGRAGPVSAKTLDAAATAGGVANSAPDSSCNGTSAEFEGTKPIPCTAQQEQDALGDLAADTPSPSPSPAAAGAGGPASTQQSPPLDVLSASECNATDPDGYTVPVDLMDPDLIDVAAAVADAFVAAEGNTSYWQALCEGDYLPTPLNACQQPDMPDAATGEVEGTHFRIRMSLECSQFSGDAVALEADAFRLKNAPLGNATVVDIEWTLLPLPPQ